MRTIRISTLSMEARADETPTAQYHCGTAPAYVFPHLGR